MNIAPGKLWCSTFNHNIPEEIDGFATTICKALLDVGQQMAAMKWFRRNE